MTHEIQFPVNGSLSHNYKALITLSGVSEIYTFKTHEQMEYGLQLYIKLFPMIQVAILECDNKYMFN